MQNLSNYSNAGRGSAPQRSPAVASIENLQAYITELTLYINENNHKYNKNMHTLKEFYEAQVADLQSERNEIAEELAGLRNQVAAARDIIAGKNTRVRELEAEVAVAREEGELARERVMVERRKIDQLYQEMAQLRENCHQAVEKAVQRAVASEEEGRNLSATIKQKQMEVQALNEKVYRLQDQLSDRYSLPEKIKDIQKQNQKLKTALEMTRRRVGEVEEKMDYAQAELDKYRKENESLRVMKGKFTAEKALQIEKAVKVERENGEQRIKKIEAENQSLVYQLNESDSHIKVAKNQVEKLQAELMKQANSIKQFQQEVLSVNQNKDAYISEFASLKTEYEGVIQRLEDSLIDYQKRNWNLEQENKELNEQLEQLRELLQEVKAINSLQPARKQYRKLAEMEVIASRPLPKQEPPPVQQQPISEAAQGEYSSDWQKLMRQIDNIKA